MKRLLTAASVLLWSALATAQAIPTVQFESFKPGAYWRWVYSELDKKTGEWSPYLVEKYTVTAVEGRNVTLEMNSSGYPAVNAEAHHKMIVDFSKCELAAADPKKRAFTVEFYTKSFGNGWQVVSKAHKNLVFTEKFNCSSPAANEEWEYLDMGGSATFRLKRTPAREASWYFLDRADALGVAAMKLFDPKQDYKFEFLDSGL